MRDAFSIFKNLSLLGNGKRLQFLQLEYLHKTFTLELIESELTNYYELFRKVCLPSSLLIQDLCTSNCPRTLSCSQYSEHLNLSQHHLYPLFLKTLFELRFPACAPRHPCYFPLA
jgi:hypothetical protein